MRGIIIMKSVEYSKYDELRESLNSVDELLHQLTYLDKARTEEELDENIPQLLALLSKYTRSERAYVLDYLPDKEISGILLNDAVKVLIRRLTDYRQFQLNR